MKIQAWGWLIAGVVALGLNGFYHDGGCSWAHRAVAEFEHNTSVVLALASGRADEFLAEVKPVVTREEPASCRVATVLARVQNKVARMQTEFAHTELAQVAPASTYQMNMDQINMDRFLAVQVAASDKLQALSDRRQAALERAQARQVEVQERIAAKLARVQAMPALQYTSFETRCPHVSVHVPRVHVPEVNVPEINVPRIHVPQIHIPQISVPAVNMGAGPV